MASGNVVHNLRTVQFAALLVTPAVEFDQMFADRLAERDLKSLADPARLGNLLRMAHPTPDHYMPALTIAGASDARDGLTFINDAIDLGSVSMRSFVFTA